MESERRGQELDIDGTLIIHHRAVLLEDFAVDVATNRCWPYSPWLVELMRSDNYGPDGTVERERATVYSEEPSAEEARATAGPLQRLKIAHMVAAAESLAAMTEVVERPRAVVQFLAEAAVDR